LQNRRAADSQVDPIISKLPRFFKQFLALQADVIHPKSAAFFINQIFYQDLKYYLGQTPFLFFLIIQDAHH